MRSYVFWLLFSLPMAAGAETRPASCPVGNAYLGVGFGTGLTLKEMDDSDLTMTIRGFIDGLGVATALGAPKECSEFYSMCLFKKMDTEFLSVLRGELAKNPDRLGEPANLWLWNAVATLCDFS